ncbi:MAG: putative viral replication protein [Cressdnaviricota sp.]|nr:MAG: putative viral replication protein [Cressdnaviricota sp.]
MAEIVADSRGTGVILNTQSLATTSEKPKQVASRKNHFFTYNNYDPNGIEAIVAVLKTFAYKGKIQTEIGDNGTPHLQGMIWCKKPHRDTEFKLPKQIHWEKLKDTDNERDYCAKDETHDGVFRTEWGFPKPLKILKKEDFYDWQVQMDNCLSYEPDDRTIYWVYSKNGGMGKSTFCKYLAYTYNAVICGKGNYSDIINIMFNANMDNTNLVVFDLPRNNGNKVSYSALEAIKNGMICNTKYETGNKLFNPPHILIFANDEPEWEAMSEDRFKVLCVD